MLLTPVDSWHSRHCGLVEGRAFTDELRAGEHEQRTTSMTALQDWLSIGPVDPLGLKTKIREAIRGLGSDEPQEPCEPTLMGRGLERC
jgi:hypothetical protein